MKHRWFPAVVFCIVVGAGIAGADSYPWPSHDPAPGPEGFATVSLVSPKHASRVEGPDLTIRLRSDNPRAALVVKLDGKHIDVNGRPHEALSGNPYDYPQWEFRTGGGKFLEIPLRGVAPGLHTLEIRHGAFGTELPRVNEQTATFLVVN